MEERDCAMFRNLPRFLYEKEEEERYRSRSGFASCTLQKLLLQGNVFLLFFFPFRRSIRVCIRERKRRDKTDRAEFRAPFDRPSPWNK